MIDLIFLKALRDKLKGGNSKSIHLNVLPGRYAARLDLANLNYIDETLPRAFLETLLTSSHFDFTISFDRLDLNVLSTEEQKRLGLLSKRLNSLAIENEDNYKEQGIKTFGFGYPILIKASRQDPAKILKAPLFIWPLEIIKSPKKVNTWSILRNKVKNESGRIVEEDVHSVNLNEVLLSFIKTDENISIPQINEDLLEDMLIDKNELFSECYKVIQSLNPNTAPEVKAFLENKYEVQIENIPGAAHFDAVNNSQAYIHFGGVFGLFKTQKESIITDLDILIEKFDQFDFEELVAEAPAGGAFSAIDTDPSQQEILSTLNAYPKKIIQGPPGTGKSQSLTALITNALSNNLKCLVVCEKKTALEVIKANLVRENDQLANLAAVIEDISKDRDQIINSVRDRINHTDSGGYFNAQTYTTIKENVGQSAAVINSQHKVLDRKIYQGKAWTQLVGEFLKRKRQSDHKLLENRLSHAWFTFSNDFSEMEQISRSLTEAHRIFSRVGTLHHPLEILHDEVFRSTNLSAAQLKLENLVRSFSTALPGALSSLEAKKQVVREWRQKEYSRFGPFVKAKLNAWVPYLSGEDFSNSTGKPPVAAMEQTIQAKLQELDQLQVSVNQTISAYKLWLENHYTEYYNPLKSSIDGYLAFISENQRIYGDAFLKNGGTRRFFTKCFSLFSGKYKNLSLQRVCVVDHISKIQSAFSAKDYIHYAFYESEEKNVLRNYVHNIDELRQFSESWYSSVPGVITGYLEKMHSRNLHPEYPDKGQVLRIESAAIDLTDGLSTDYELLPVSNQFTDTHEIIQRIFYYKKELNHILSELRAFRLFYNHQLESFTAFLKEIESVTLPFRSEVIFKAESPVINSFDNSEVALKQLEESVSVVHTHIESFRNYYYWRNYYYTQPELTQKVITAVVECGCEDWSDTFECWYLHWLLSDHEDGNLPDNEDHIHAFVRAKTELRNAQVKSILHHWRAKQMQSLHRVSQTGISPSALYNKRGSRGEKRNSIRRIIKTDFELFTDFFPVVMASPSVCSSILPLTEGLFDLVIFDEASQLRLEDTFPALLRGKIRLVSGDSQQMPPSSYFQGGNAILMPADEEEEGDTPDIPRLSIAKANNSLELAESESLLVYAENSNYKQSYLRIHYRSQHPSLINFSNHAFYGKRLLPMPCKQEYKCIQFVEVNGLYEDQLNRDEARQVVDILLHHIKRLANGKYPSVGVATFNLYQRNLILEEIIKARQQNEGNDKTFNDLGPDFFVKNLENIQGDERDIIIISTTFGRRADGSFSQHFGPIIQSKGYKLLNVLITRAKLKVYLCTSIPPEAIRGYSALLQQHKNTGRGIFYAYLAYAKAVSDKNTDQAETILRQLYDNCDAKVFDIEHDVQGSESPFEEEVYYRLAAKIGQHRLAQQHKIGGFRIDLIVKSEMNEHPFIAIECDGAKYHSSNEAYSWDMFRQSQLENFGFTFYRIWSTNWWHSTESELKKLAEFIQAKDLKERNSDVPPMIWADPEEEEIVAVTTQNETKPKITNQSVVTLKDAEGKIFKVRFSRDERNQKKHEDNGTKIIYDGAPLAISLLGRTEGEICQLGMLEVYYEIIHIE